MPHPSPQADSEPPASVRDLISELVRVKAAIRGLRKQPFPAAAVDDVTSKELLALYAHERAIVRNLRGRHRRWRAETAISEAKPPETDRAGDRS